MSQSNHLFAGLTHLPQYPFETQRKKPKGVWENGEATTLPAQSVQTANTALTDSESENNSQHADTGSRIKNANKKTAREPDGQLVLQTNAAICAFVCKGLNSI